MGHCAGVPGATPPSKGRFGRTHRRPTGPVHPCDNRRIPTMNYEFLLHHRDELCRAARLANLAYAYQWVGNFAWKIAWLGLTGEVVLRGPNEQGGRPHATLVAQDFSQSVAEEHFLPEEIDELHA